VNARRAGLRPQAQTRAGTDPCHVPQSRMELAAPVLGCCGSGLSAAPAGYRRYRGPHRPCCCCQHGGTALWRHTAPDRQHFQVLTVAPARCAWG
jgi:hypothetical protein